MPIEIRELHIQLNLKPAEGEEDASAADGNEQPRANREALLADIEDMLAHKLQDQQER